MVQSVDTSVSKAEKVLVRFQLHAQEIKLTVNQEAYTFPSNVQLVHLLPAFILVVECGSDKTTMEVRFLQCGHWAISSKVEHLICNEEASEHYRDGPQG